MKTFFHIAIATLVLGVVVGFSPALSAEEISVEVRSIAASEKGEKVDSELSHLKSKLEKVFGSYSSFQQVGMDSIELDKGETKSISLPDGNKMEVTFSGFAKDLIKLGIEVADKLSTTLRASSGSTFFQAGLDYDDGILILAITVEK